MAGGWSKDGDVQKQIDVSVQDAVAIARSRLPQGESSENCRECGAAIPLARQKAIPGVRFCVPCQTERDSRFEFSQGFNRRAGKDSQLR